MKDSLDLIIMAPEIFVAAMALLLMVAGLFFRPHLSWSLHWLAIAVLGTAIVAVGKLSGTWSVGLHGMFIDDGFGRVVKVLLLTASIGSLVLARPYQRAKGINQFEYPVLVMLATVGMMLMVSAHDMLALYVGLELQSLALYVLAAFARDDARASEAGMKYFLLGALSSGLLLFGISLLYGLAGSTDFTVLQIFFSQRESGETYVALVFILAALAFKVSAAPFHMWTPDVYQGAPTPVTAFFAAAPKVAALALLTRVLYQPLIGMVHDWQQVLTFLAIVSMLVGGFAAIVQTSLKRLLAYSSISHVGYALVALASGTADGVQGVVIYLAIYFLNTLGVFAVILGLRRDGLYLDKISDCAGLSKQRPLLALAMGVFMFSLAGIPPLAGFYAKLYVFLAAWHAGLYPLVFVGLLSSAVAAYYYLRIIKVMYFDDVVAPVDAMPEWSLRSVVLVAVCAMLCFGFAPTVITDMAQTAAVGLLKHE